MSEVVKLDAGATSPIYDCWNTIGVNGNGSCRELARVTHCRNCGVYAAAAAQLLDRPVSGEERRAWTAHYAAEVGTRSATRTSVVIFRLGEEWLALPTGVFQEVSEVRVGLQLHRLPHRGRSLVLGLVNLRGELLVCASLGRLLGIENAETNPESKILSRQSANQLRGTGLGTLECRVETLDPRLGLGSARRGLSAGGRLLVTRWEGQRLVFPVAEVAGMERVPQDELREPPATVTGVARAYTERVFLWREQTVGLLSPALLFAALSERLGE